MFASLALSRAASTVFCSDSTTEAFALHSTIAEPTAVLEASSDGGEKLEWKQGARPSSAVPRSRSPETTLFLPAPCYASPSPCWSGRG